jgi:hypothetical protein
MKPDPIEKFHEHIKRAIQAGTEASYYEVCMLPSFKVEALNERNKQLEEATDIANVMPSSHILLRFVQTVRESLEL